VTQALAHSTGCPHCYSPSQQYWDCQASQATMSSLTSFSALSHMPSKVLSRVKVNILRSDFLQLHISECRKQILRFQFIPVITKLSPVTGDTRHQNQSTTGLHLHAFISQNSVILPSSLKTVLSCLS